jgi:predicted alpha/beta-hydrolase family hydrolase
VPVKPPSSDRRSSGQPASLRDVPTPQGPARVHVHEPAAEPAGTLVLGHGAGGGIAAPDLRAAATAGRAAGWRVVLVEQPWRVAGRRVAPAPPRLDEAWLAVLADLADLAPGRLAAGPPARLVVGGRSAGARVACRTAQAVGAAAVVCLAFPLHPPGRPDKSRAAELAGAGVRVVVVQGANDAFGTPAEIAALQVPGVELVEATGDHALRSAAEAVGVGVRLALRAAAPLAT